MTIASEISRLQGAKACLKASLEAKGVTVPSNLTLENYYTCIDSINTLNERYFDVLVIGGGGGGGESGRDRGGGGAGGVICKETVKTIDSCFNITVGNGGAITSCRGCNGGDSCIKSDWFEEIAYGGGGGGSGWQGAGAGGSGGGGGGGSTGGGAACSGQGYRGGNGCNCGYCSGGGGGGAGGAGGNGNSMCGGIGGAGITIDFTGKSETFAKGGYGGSYWSQGSAGDGKGNGGDAGCCGKSGLVVIRYLSDGSCNINCATGGNRIYTCGNYKFHCFTSSGTFCIVS